MTDPILKASGAAKVFEARDGRKLKAVTDVSFSAKPGETVAIVGESGCGKSTLARLILKLEDLSDGDIWFDGKNISSLDRKALIEYRKDVQMVFQDPYASLNPRLSAGAIVREPLDNFKIGTPAERRERVRWLLSKVGLNAGHEAAFPSQLSGGQRQRLGIARALAVKPKLIVADEPVSALDVSIQAQVLNLMMDLQEEFGFTCLFVSHDISVVSHVSHRVVVMYLGRIVEEGNTADVLNSPHHPYTRALLGSVPIEHPRDRKSRTLITGETPSPFNPPSGCAFRNRCVLADKGCAKAVPVLEPVGQQVGHRAACFKLAGTFQEQTSP